MAGGRAQAVSPGDSGGGRRRAARDFGKERWIFAGFARDRRARDGQRAVRALADPVVMMVSAGACGASFDQFTGNFEISRVTKFRDLVTAMPGTPPSSRWFCYSAIRFLRRTKTRTIWPGHRGRHWG